MPPDPLDPTRPLSSWKAMSIRLDRYRQWSNRPEVLWAVRCPCHPEHLGLSRDLPTAHTIAQDHLAVKHSGGSA